jgi:hypothetical protein
LTPPIKIQRNTGLRIPKRKAEKIIAAYVSGMSLRGICRAFGTNWSAVSALIRNRPEMVEKARTEAREAWATLAALGTAELLARQSNMQTHSLIVSAGIATDKAALLEDTGEQPPEVPEEPASEAWAHCLRALEASDPQS